MNTSKEKKTALVTGASSGIGKAFAELLAAEGYDLVLVSRNGDELNRIVGMEMTKNQTKVIPVPLDLAKSGAVGKLIKELKDRNIKPEIIINNAGVGLVGEASKLSINQQLQMVDLNVRALSEITLRFLPELLGRNNGGIINVSSVAAFLPGPYMSVYYASKAYVQSFSDGLAEELATSNVTLTTLCPGPVDTAFQSTAGMDTKRWAHKFLTYKSPQEVAEIGWAGFKAGKRTVYPGKSDMLTAWVAGCLPKVVLMPIVNLFQKPKQH